MGYIAGTNGNDDLYSGRNADTLDGGAGDDTLVGNGGDDTLIGGKNNDSLSGGDGSDVFVYANGDGNDIITDYDEDDIIKITSGTVSKISTSSNGDVIFTIGSGRITVQNAGDKIITYENSNGEKNFYPINLNSAGTSATLLAAYGKDEFNAVEFDDSDTLRNIDASQVQHDISITGNKQKNVITGTGENDYIDGGAAADKLYGGDGSDTIVGGTGDDSLSGGEGADVFIYNKGDGNDKILDYADEDKISISGDTVKDITTSGNNIILKLTSGKNISVMGGKDHFITYIENGVEHVYPENPIVPNAKKTAVTLLAGYSADTFNVTSYDDFGTTARTIDASAVDHDLSITGNKQNNVIIGADGDNIIDGGAGADKLYGGSGNNTLIGGTGNDTLEGGTGDNVFVYANSGGNDVITNYKSGDVIQVSGTVSGAGISGNDYVFTVGKGKITVKNAKNKYIYVTDNTGDHWYPESPESQLVYSSGKVELKKGYAGDAFDVADFEAGFAGKVYTIDASAVQHGLNITGNKEANAITGTEEDDYIDGKAGADKLYGGDGNDTIVGGTGNDILTGGDGADVFIWNKGDGNDKILDYASEDTISISGDTVSSIKTSGANVILRLASGKNISVMGGKDNVITYVDNDGEHVYPEDPVLFNKAGTSATILAGYTEDSYDFSGNSKLVSLDASAVQHSLSITGNKNANRITGTEEDDYIDGKAGADKLYGGDGDDTIVGGTGNDSLTGGEGADTFVWSKGDGNDKILDFKDEDNISISGATVSSIGTSGNNVILTVGSNKITVVGGKDKVINYVDDAGVHGYPKAPFEVNSNKTAVTLLAEYSADVFDVTTQKEFGTTARTINASAVDQDLTIIGNAKNNVIYGGDGNNTIDGGKGNDSLTGGTGDNVFVYANGGGNDVITNYKSGDIIQVSGTVSGAGVSGNDYVFTVGKGKITVKNGKNKYIYVTDNTGGTWYPENPEPYVVYSSGKVEIKKGYAGDAFDVANFEDGFAGKVYTIDASAVTHSLNITGNKQANEIIGTGQNDYIDGGAGADVIYGGKGNDSLYGGDGNDTIEGGTGNDILTGGAGSDEFVWNKGDGNDKILDYEEEDTIRIVGDNVKSPTVSGNNVIFKLASGKNISVMGGKGKTISYTDDKGEHVYPEASVIFNDKGTAATLTAEYAENSYNFSADSKLISVEASAVTHAINITGNKKANNIIGSDGNDTLSGGAGNDTLSGGKGNDILTGGSGADVFVYNKGDGNDKILDFDNEDSLLIAGDTYSTYTTNGEDIILTLGSKKKITVTGGVDKVISGTDANGEFVIGSPVVYNVDFTAATLTSNYNKSSFDSTDYSAYVDTLATINASQVTHSLGIYGSTLSNRITGTEQDDYIDGGAGKDVIYGGDGDDTLLGSAGNDSLFGGDGDDSLWGGAGTDTLTGGDGSDTFVFYGTDGKNTITDFDSSIDTLVALSGSVSLYNVTGDDVIFKIGSGQVTLKDSRTQYVEVVDASGNRLASRNGDRS